MIYLKQFAFSEKKLADPFIYPYSIFVSKTKHELWFKPITVLYGSNGSGKSTLLNLLANKLDMVGKESVDTREYNEFLRDCQYLMNEKPIDSRYIKSEDILYEVKKIQQERILRESYLQEQIRKGKSLDEATADLQTKEAWKQLERQKFAQDKYSNGETAMQLFDDWFLPDSLYLLDEPEVSLSPQNQILLAEKLNQMARLLNCQFIIATHSPFMLGTLQGNIYNVDSNAMEEAVWTELENIRVYFDFFKKHDKNIL